MRLKKPTKLLSVLLSFVLVLTSAPISAIPAITAFASDDSEAIAEVEDAMASFEALFDGSTAYTNMTAGYEAYVDAQEALDAYIYGSVSTALDGVADALNTAIANMEVWTAYLLEATEFTIGETTTSEDDVVNLVYANSTVSTTTDYSSYASLYSTSSNHGEFFPYYADTVIIYNGTDTPSLPLSMALWKIDDDGEWVRYYYVRTTSDDFELRNNYYGYENAELGWYDYGDTTTDNNLQYSTDYDSDVYTSSIEYDNGKYVFSNVFYYTGTPTETLTTIASTDWEGCLKNTTTGTMTYADNSIYVLDTTALQEAVISAMASITDISSYSEGGLADAFATVESAINFDFTDYSYSDGVAAAAEECAADIDELASTIASSVPAGEANSGDYETIRSAMTLTIRETYDAGNTIYSSSSWATFVAAYEDAEAIMAAVITDGYVDIDSAETVAETLTAAFNALEADEEYLNSLVTEIEEAMATFEAMMDGSTIYTPLSDAYAAYVDCQEAIDAYTYGGLASALDGVADALYAAMAEMEVWDGVFTLDTAEFTIGATTTSEDDVVNLIYANSTVSTYDDYYSYTEITSGSYHGGFYPYYADTVMLYNGVDTPSMPLAMALWKSYSSGYYISYYYVRTLEDDFELRNNYYGYENGDLGWYDYGDSSMLSNLQYSSDYDSDVYTTSIYYDQGYYNYSNVFYYTGTPTSTLTTYDSTSWEGLIRRNTTSGTLTYEDNNIYVLNSVPLQEAIASAMAIVDGVENYTQGGLADVFALIDTAVNFDFSDYSYSSDVSSAVSSCADDLDTLVSSLTSATASTEEDYDSVRSAMTTYVMATYAAGNTGYTEDSWEAFVEAYVAAQTMMAAVVETSYVETDGATIAANLTAAYLALTTETDKQDTSELMTLIDYFEALTNIFTEESYSAVEAIILEAKVAVWARLIITELQQRALMRQMRRQS